MTSISPPVVIWRWVATDEEISQPRWTSYRQPLSFYGSTRSYHHVLRMHDLEDLGMRLHKLSLDGRWKEMQEIITEDDLLQAGGNLYLRRLPGLRSKQAGIRFSDGFRHGGTGIPARSG